VLLRDVELLCAGAERDVLLVAPFMKLSILRRLLEHVDGSVDIGVVTRWRPEEIVAGVSDLEVWPLVRDTPRCRLYLCNDLHAKLYCADAECLVGSANLTGKALGMGIAPNLELLVPLPRSIPAVQAFESALHARLVEVDEDLYRTTCDLVRLLLVDAPPVTLELEPGTPSEFAIRLDLWRPTSRQPEDLWLFYRGDSDELAAGARHSAAMDLEALDLPANLGDASFCVAVAARLLAMPLVSEVDRFVGVRDRRFGEVQELLEKQLPGSDGVRDWQTLFRWLMHFLPNRYVYRRPRHSELIARR
jgi:hypothetical protein